MTDIELALLKSLAMRPCPAVALYVRPILNNLCEAGYVEQGASGWMATELGCIMLESQRATASQDGLKKTR